MILIRRAVVLAAGVTGQLTLFASTANALSIPANHCEPLRCRP